MRFSSLWPHCFLVVNTSWGWLWPRCFFGGQQWVAPRKLELPAPGHCQLKFGVKAIPGSLFGRTRILEPESLAPERFGLQMWSRRGGNFRNPENGCTTTGTTAAASSYLSGATAGNGNLDGTITPAHTSPRVFPKARALALCMAPEWLKGGVQVETFSFGMPRIL